MMVSRSILGLLGVFITACATPASDNPGRQSNTPDATSGVFKSITIAQLNPIKSYGPWEFGTTAGGGASLAEVHTAGLVSEDRDGNSEPRLAAKLPSLDDGTITMMSDGRMQTRWSLRPGVRWQDGAPFSADDVVFSWQIAVEPDLVSSLSTVPSKMESVVALDPLTVLITWNTVFYRSVELHHRNLWLFSKHLLGESFAGDKQAFLAQPYFNSEYVNLGPFRLVDFGLGERQIFERYDDYFLGRPRLDRVILQTIADPNALFASLQAGAVDIAAEKLFGTETYVALRDEWQRSGEGLLLQRQDNWPYVRIQFDPQWARPTEISRDVRVRRGLLYGIDRQALTEAVLPGFADTNGDTFMAVHDPRSPIVGQPFAQYRYDPQRAAQELAAAGWVRGSDGRLLNRDGVQVQIEVRGENQNYEKEVPILANWWRQLGIDATEFIPAIALSRDREYRATLPALETTSRGRSEDIFISFDGRLPSLAQNRWTGANIGHYANPSLDALIDKLDGMLDERDQATVLKGMADIMAADLPALPLYFRPAFVAVRHGISAMAEDYTGTKSVGAVARNSHLWDRDTPSR
ncbi:MAG TPA: ABC transporter substrate-binding protein [Chloroflexota bacterium]